jgi:hypothetical protein
MTRTGGNLSRSNPSRSFEKEVVEERRIIESTESRDNDHRKAQKAETTTTDNQEPKATALKKTVNPQYKFFPYTLTNAGVT